MGDQGDAPLESVVAELQKQMSKKQTFEGAVTSLTSLLREKYPSASTSERSTLYNAVSKAAILLQSRYTAKGFWVLGLRLFEEALQVVSLPKEKKQIKSFIEKARSFVGEEEEQRSEAPATMRAGTSGGFLFEGQLTVEREPPPPSWLVAQNALTALLRNVPTTDGAQAATDGAGGDEEMREEHEWGTEPYRLNLTRVEQELNLMGMEHEFGADDIARAIEATLQEGGHRAAPPASKDEVAKLRVEPVTTEVMKRLGEETECAVCREVFVGGESVQEMPCKHSFHPSCLKPWLDEHNSCPVCRYEMRTDDLEYELKKEADKEAEEERKGAANALRGGEFMYI